MEPENYIRLFAGRVITDSKLDKPTKYQLLNFVEESDIHDVMNLLVDGEIKSINEDQKYDVLKKFQNSEVPDKIDYFLKQEKNIVSDLVSWVIKAGLVGIGAVSYYVTKGVYRQIRGLLNKCYKECKPLIKDPYRFHVCKLQCEVKAHEKELEELKKIDCKKQDDPDKCKQKVDKAIRVTEQQIKDKKEKVKTFKGE